ncbi:MAG: hypothetical protein EA368_09565 [Leptolyngbya sp. DLM2.Bin27]|nr:MAG: hypothetical protein EA368_09565 [Leptolyngbya sp. DLM2.Bin27]
MASHWPVIVGINQYESLQPLMYAQFDALELRDFLVNEVGLPPQGCSLLTDVSPMVYQGAAAPTQAVLLERLAQSCDRAGPDDTVWFFFSGYGVQWQGQDYLLPIDADPNRIEQTGILVKTMLEKLAQGNQRQSIVMLDMNRPQSALNPAPDGQGLGAQTLALAEDLAITLVLSCQPDQFSQETLAVRHGLFTEALIEAMRFHGCVTLAQLIAYLSDRLPELCQHHWRPVQNPVAVVPPGQQHALLVPASLVGQMPLALPPAAEFTPPDRVDPALVLLPAGETLAGGTEPDSSSVPPTRPWPLAAPAATDLPAATLPQVADPTATAHSTSEADTISWQRWGLVAAGLLVLLVGVLWRNQNIFLGQTSTPDPPAPAAPTEPPAALAPAPDPVLPATGDALFPGTAASGAEALERARNALEQRQFGAALSWLSQIPEEERPVDYQALVDRAETGYATVAQSGDVALNQARRLIEPVSASLFNDAIEQARQVPVGDSAYDQAQADIARWSQVILDLALGRAASGDLEGAINAARLVPEDQGETWGQAQSQIQQWEQRRANRRLLQEAQGLLQPDQATSFQSAIALAQQIPPDYPESPVAQERIDQWSRDILAIARTRAAADQIPGAIAAADLVPPGTSAYDQAQEAIRQWQGQ